MIFPKLVIEKNFLYPEEIHNYFSISNELSFDVTTVSLLLTLSYFSLLDIGLFSFGNRPRRLWFMSKKSFETKQTSLIFNSSLQLQVHCTSSTVEALQNAHRHICLQSTSGITIDYSTLISWLPELKPCRILLEFTLKKVYNFQYSKKAELPSWLYILCR